MAEQEIEPDAISIQLDTFFNASTTPQNYVHVGKDGSFTVTGTIRLVSPPSITFNSDDLIAGSVAAVNPEIHDFTIGVKAAQDVGDYKCQHNAMSTIFTTEVKAYVVCNFVQMGQWSERNDMVSNSGFAPKQILSPNDPKGLLKKVSITVSASDFANLGMVSSSAQGVPYKLYVYPVMVIDRPASDDFLAFDKGGIEVTAMLYDTQAQAQQAALKGGPAGNPGYGSTVTTPTTRDLGGSKVIGFLNTFLAAFLGAINEIIYFLFYWLVAPLIQAVLSIRTYTDTFANVIYPGWVVVRNICNMIFIVAIIAIAMATLFRVPSYHFRELLVNLIVGALMVNFSLVIAQAILGVADTIQSQFLPNNVEVIRSLARDLMVSNTRDAFLTKGLQQLGSFTETVRLFLFVSMALASFVVFSAIAVFLVIRIAMLWILLLLSPIPYVAGVLPATAGFRDQWWGQFIKYAFFTPIMAFFLNITAIMANSYLKIPLIQSISTAELSKELGGSDFAAFVFQMVSNVLLLVFLLASIRVAESFGVMGAHAFSDLTQKGLWAPFRSVGFGLNAGKGWAYRHLQERTAGWAADEKKLSFKKVGFALINPGAVKKAIADRRHEFEHATQHKVEAGASQAYQQFMGDKPGDELSHATLHGGLDKKKEMTLQGERANLENLQLLTDNMGVKEGSTGKVGHIQEADKHRWLGQFLKLVDEKGLNEILKNAHRYGGSKDYTASRNGLSAYLNDLVDRGVLSPGEAGHLITTITDVAYKNKEYWYAENYKTAHGHPYVFEMEKDEKGGYSEEKVVGKAEYDDMQAKIAKSLESDDARKEVTEALAIAKSKAGDRDLTPQEAEQITGVKLGQLRAKYEKQHADELKKKKPDEHTRYENYKGYVNSLEEVAVNYKKAPSQADAREGHYTRFNEIDADGNSKFSDLGIDFIATFNESRAKQSGEWNPKTNAASLQSFYTDATANERVKSMLIERYHMDEDEAAVISVIRMKAYKDIFLTKAGDEKYAKVLTDNQHVIAKEIRQTIRKFMEDRGVGVAEVLADKSKDGLRDQMIRAIDPILADPRTALGDKVVGKDKEKENIDKLKYENPEERKASIEEILTNLR